ncbi:MAG: hypothetical protein EPO64_12385 [Nitrospirae bacterium]|nr:MAG: hypothetical protein EPO64_12385 [Nitrospirota bacterium]
MSATRDQRAGGQGVGEQGVALIGAVLVTLILSLLGTVSLNFGIQEIENATTAQNEMAAQHLAEAGADLVVQWFHNPRSIPDGAVGSLLAKRYEGPDTGPSFFNEQGGSQFIGTADRPDLSYDAARPADDRLLNDPGTGWFRSLRGLGRMLKLKVYGPSRPGLLCTVEVTAGVGGLTKTLSVQLGANTIPPLRAAIQIGEGGGRASEQPLSVWAHWGDLKLKGDVRFDSRQAVPAKTPLASVTGQSYAEVLQREDRWLDIFVGGEAIFPPAPSGGSAAPSNVLSRQDPFPGLREDRWDYEFMKKQAIRYGSYYAMDRNGLLYPNGRVEPGLGLAAAAVLESQGVGDHHGLVFIDTLDQQPPRPDNLGTLTLETAYAEGLFVINAHLHLKPKGEGQSISVLSPPDEGSSSLGTRIPVQLTGVHIQGVVYTAGDVSFEGRPRIYGALVTNGRVMGTAQASDHLELWYNDELRSGLVRGLPLVFMAPGTWQEKY